MVASTDDPEMSAKRTFGIDPVLHALQHVPETAQVLLLQPTSLMRNLLDIEGILAFQAQHACPSVVSVTASAQHPQWMVHLGADHQLAPVSPPASAETRQQLQPVYDFKSALCLADQAWLQNYGSLMGPGTLG